MLKEGLNTSVKTTNIYSKPGSYTVTFSVRNSEGTRHESSETIIIRGKDSK
jgi:PKD repeat protein